jgi:hypothetical protein
MFFVLFSNYAGSGSDEDNSSCYLNLEHHSARPAIRNVLGKLFTIYVFVTNFRLKSVNKSSTGCYSFSLVSTILGKSINLFMVLLSRSKHGCLVPILCRSQLKVKIIAGEAEGPINLSIAAQNSNSLNVTSNLENWELKIKGIVSLQTDIILLSDIRLKRKDGLDVTNKLKAAMLKCSGRKYDLWENSTKKGRGVGILIARDLGAKILDGCEDQDQNIILLSMNIKAQNLVIGSIYGPNGACPNFYWNLNI